MKTYIVVGHDSDFELSNGKIDLGDDENPEDYIGKMVTITNHNENGMFFTQEVILIEIELYDLVSLI